MHPVRLLLVEDDATIAQVLTEALSDEGYTVSQAASPSTALTLLATTRFDLVLSDAFTAHAAVPYAWLAQVRQRIAAPILICSGWPAAAFTEYRARGFAALIAKPFDLDDLLAHLAHLTACVAGPCAALTGDQRTARTDGEGEGEGEVVPELSA